MDNNGKIDKTTGIETFDIEFLVELFYRKKIFPLENVKIPLRGLMI